MKKLSMLILAALLLASCSAKAPDSDLSEEPTDNIRHGFTLPLEFKSEEEFVDYVLEKQDESPSAFRAFSEGEELDEHGRLEAKVVAHTHYYRLKNPPPDAKLVNISVSSLITVQYNTQKFEADGEPESLLFVLFAPDSFLDIETEGMWVRHASAGREEEQIIELNGIKYYIWKVSSTWCAEWMNEDGGMYVNLPHRFTFDEVWGLISDLERVEIG